jgi:L-iditol 2-dehydrogenase
MRAATILGPGRMEVRDFPEPEAREEGELVVRMERASVCGSDVHSLFHGFHNPAAVGRPGYPGHEGVGVVEQSRSATVPVGARVLTVPVGNVGGCFAESQLIRDGQVVPLPEGGDAARLLMAQQYGTTLYAMRLFWPADHTAMANGVAAVVGAGSAGLFFLQQALQRGFERVIVSDLDADRLEVARRLGASRVVDATRDSIVDAVLEETAGIGADLVIEAAGYDACRADAIAAVRVLGTVGFFGFPERHGAVPFPQFDAFRKVARIQWAGGTQSEPGLVAFRDAIRDIHESRIEVDHCLGTEFDLEHAPEAMALARDLGHGAVKVSLDIAGGPRG